MDTTVVCTVGELAEPAFEVPMAERALAVDDVFLAAPELRAIVARADDGSPVLVSRANFQQLITGRRGYGRALHHRRALAEISFPDPLVLFAETGVFEASQAMLHRDVAQRYDDAVVSFADATFGLVSASAVMNRVAELYGHQSLHDPLTGLANRAQLVRFLTPNEESRAGDVAVLFLDLDRFKIINDSMGHACGDQLLTEIARRIASCLREGDLACRVGGDEFVVVLPGVSEISTAEHLATRILTRVHEPLEVGGTTLRLTTSIGIARGPRHPDHADELIRKADLAMYEAKARGRARYSIYAHALDERVTHRFSLDARLRAAVDLDEFSLEFQPIVALNSGAVAKYEALIRWDDPERGRIAPDEFIPMAEETGLIIPIGHWVLREALSRLVDAFDPSDPCSPGLAINVSTHELSEPDFVETISDALSQARVSPERLCLEITETNALHETTALRTNLTSLRTLGIGIALDDFGTGYSSLSLLHQLPITEVKIDRSFVTRMLNAPHDRDLVGLIIHIAHGLGHTVTAEGIEHPDQTAALRAMGCDLAQGYHLGRPAPFTPEHESGARRHGSASRREGNGSAHPSTARESVLTRSAGPSEPR